MAIFERSPEDLTGAYVNVINKETGEMKYRCIQPEDVLAGMSRGMTVADLAVSLDTPVNVIEHAIMQIPNMMAWRNIAEQKTETESEPESYLPDISDVVDHSPQKQKDVITPPQLFSGSMPMEESYPPVEDFIKLQEKLKNESKDPQTK